jgi:hypothetical protein
LAPASAGPSKYAWHSRSVLWLTSKIARACAPSPIFTWRASRRSRVPPQSGQGWVLR